MSFEPKKQFDSTRKICYARTTRAKVIFFSPLVFYMLRVCFDNGTSMMTRLTLSVTADSHLCRSKAIKGPHAHLNSIVRCSVCARASPFYSIHIVAEERLSHSHCPFQQQSIMQLSASNAKPDRSSPALPADLQRCHRTASLVSSCMQLFKCAWNRRRVRNQRRLRMCAIIFAVKK